MLACLSSGGNDRAERDNFMFKEKENWAVAGIVSMSSLEKMDSFG